MLSNRLGLTIAHQRGENASERQETVRNQTLRVLSGCEARRKRCKPTEKGLEDCGINPLFGCLLPHVPHRTTPHLCPLHLPPTVFKQRTKGNSLLFLGIIKLYFFPEGEGEMPPPLVLWQTVRLEKIPEKIFLIFLK